MDKPLYIIGIEGGGTKTTAVLCALDGIILSEAQGGPSNFHIIGIDMEYRGLDCFCNIGTIHARPSIEIICSKTDLVVDHQMDSSPGLKGIETASGKDIADIIIQFIEKRFESMDMSKDVSHTRTRGKG